MNAFESLVATLLRIDGYWATTCFKVNLTKADKRRMGHATTPRAELDVLAYQASKNEVLVVECKSFLDSPGVVFRNGQFEPPVRYKVFTESKMRETVRMRLTSQLTESGMCRPNPTITFCLAAAKIAKRTDQAGMVAHFKANRWRLFDYAGGSAPNWNPHQRLATRTTSPTLLQRSLCATRNPIEKQGHQIPNGDDKNWIRLCGAIDGFRCRFRRWPVRVRMPPEVLHDLEEHVFSRSTLARLADRIRLVADDVPIVAEDDEGNAYSYGAEGFADSEPDAVQPDRH